MKTIEINVDQILTSEELRRTFDFQGIQRGDKVVLVSKEEINNEYKKVLIIILLMVLVAYFIKIFNEDHSAIDFQLKDESNDEIEHKIENEFGIEIDYQIDSKKTDAIDELFGKWENIDIDLQQIREKSWLRNK